MKTNFFNSRLGALAISGAATLISAVFWLNNVVAAYQYHAALFRGIPNAVMQGLLPMLRWSTADVSTVSTFIPFFGFLLIFAGLCRKRRGEDWPYFPGYDRFNIALGLIGTLWGIILIGYYPAKEVTVAALMNCLHTAMYSTLISVIWVMVVKPVIFAPWFHALQRSAGAPEEDEAMLYSLDALVSGINQADHAVQGAAQSVAAFQQELAKLNESLRANRTAETERAQQIAAALQSMGALLAGFQSLEKELAADHERLAQENQVLGEKLAASQSDLAASEQSVANAAAENRQLQQENQSLSEKIAALEAESAKLARQLAAIREALK